MTSGFPLAEQAESFLAGEFARLRDATSKMAAFRTKSGRHFALARERKEEIFVWLEEYDGSIKGVTVNNQKRPGMPYAPDQGRSSSLSTQCSRMAIGKPAWYLRCSTLGALERLAKWYAIR